VVAAYSSGDVVRSLVIFLLWIALIGGGIWLLIVLFRNRNLALWAKLGLVVLVVLLPPLGLGMCIVAWVSTKSRSRAEQAETAADAWSEPSTAAPAMAKANETPAGRRLPFPPRSPGSASEAAPEPQDRGT